MAQKLAVFILVWLWISACAAAPASPTRIPATSTLPKPSSTASISPAITSQIVSPLLAYSKSGGIMGINEEWTLYQDGSLKSGKGVVIRLTSDQAQAIWQRLLEKNFIQLSKAVKTPSGCADCFWMTVTLYQGGQTYQLKTNLIDKETSEDERSIIEELDTLIRDAGGK